jgi:hypothetical protein
MIKGENPWTKKETFYEKIRYFCSKHHWNKGEQLSAILDEAGDGYPKPTIKLFLYNCIMELRGWTPLYRLRMLISRFYNHGLSENEIWEAGHTMSKYALKVLKAFKKSERHGYPGSFSEYNEHEWKSVESYNEAIKEGRIIGGGTEAWEKVLDHIIMALEFRVYDGHNKFQHDWYLKWFGMDPYDESNECNRAESYEYRYKDDPKSIGGRMGGPIPPEDFDKCEYIQKTTMHINFELIRYAEDVVQDGYELLGFWWGNLWD